MLLLLETLLVAEETGRAEGRIGAEVLLLFLFFFFFLLVLSEMLLFVKVGAQPGVAKEAGGAELGKTDGAEAT